MWYDWAEEVDRQQKDTAAARASVLSASRRVRPRVHTLSPSQASPHVTIHHLQRVVVVQVLASKHEALLLQRRQACRGTQQHVVGFLTRMPHRHRPLSAATYRGLCAASV
jgi:hypothetical protein